MSDNEKKVNQENNVNQPVSSTQSSENKTRAPKTLVIKKIVQQAEPAKAEPSKTEPQKAEEKRDGKNIIIAVLIALILLLFGWLLYGQSHNGKGDISITNSNTNTNTLESANNSAPQKPSPSTTPAQKPAATPTKPAATQPSQPAKVAPAINSFLPSASTAYVNDPVQFVAELPRDVGSARAYYDGNQINLTRESATRYRTETLYFSSAGERRVKLVLVNDGITKEFYSTIIIIERPSITPPEPPSATGTLRIESGSFRPVDSPIKVGGSTPFYYSITNTTGSSESVEVIYNGQTYGKQSNYQFNSAGNVQVTLRVKAGGQTAEQTCYVQVNAPPPPKTWP